MRIRSVKPDFFRDEKLSDLEIQHPALKPMLIFAGLWGVSDKSGVFLWSPRTLHLDILPLIRINLEKTLDLLECSGIVRRFEYEGKLYGHVVHFEKHQRISGKEAQEGNRYPPPGEYLKVKSEGSTREAPGKQRGSTREASETAGREGKGREGNNGAELPHRFPATAAAGAAIEKPVPLYSSVQKAFLAKNDDKFTDYAKEGAAIKGLIKKAHARVPGAEESLLKDMLAHFWKLRTSGDKFWQGQPFLPSALNASGIWDRVLETMRNKEMMTDPVAMAVARGEIA